MSHLFEIMTTDAGKDGQDKEIRLGIRLRLSGNETLCPISRSCRSLDVFESEVQAFREELDGILDQGKAFFRASRVQGELDIRSDMGAEEIWSILSATEDDGLFVEGLNSLEESKRREVAEYVLTKCNIFSGKAAVFSSRYDDGAASLE